MNDRPDHPKTTAPLHTARLRLRCVDPADATALSTLMTPSVSRWLISWPVPFTPAMAAARIDEARAAHAAGDMLPFVIERLADATFLGWLSLTRTADRRALLSYWLGQAHHGYGFMREALGAAIPSAFDLLGLDTIEAAAQVGNGNSLTLLRACGMVDLGERMIFAPSRGRDELCAVLALHRPP